MQTQILVADANQDQAAMLCKCLQAAGYRVVLTRDGHAAWDLCTKAPLDLILLHVDLPGLTSWRLLYYLRTRDQVPGLPIILLGNARTTEQVVHWFRMGIDAYIDDPCCTRLVLAQVASLLWRSAKASGCEQATSIAGE